MFSQSYFKETIGSPVSTARKFIASYPNLLRLNERYPESVDDSVLLSNLSVACINLLIEWCNFDFISYFCSKKKIENLKFMIKNDALFIRTHHYVYHYELSTKQGIEVLQFCTKYYRIAIINMANGIMYI